MTSFFIDSADRRQVEPLLRSGLVAGVTTNPTLLRRAGVANDAIPALVAWAAAAGARTIFLQAWGSDAAELERRGRALYALDPRVAVKLPVTAAGLAATARLEGDGIPVLVTAVYSAVQVLPVIASGATYVAPYLGRMNDAGRDGFTEIVAMQRIIDASGSPLRVLVASLRSPGDAARLAEAGIADFTLAPKLWEEFFADPLTADAVRVFDADTAAGG